METEVEQDGADHEDEGVVGKVDKVDKVGKVGKVGKVEVHGSIHGEVKPRLLSGGGLGWKM